MLEEIKFDYKITEIDLSKGDQFNINFRNIIEFKNMLDNLLKDEEIDKIKEIKYNLNDEIN